MDSMITIGKKKLRSLYRKINEGKPISLDNCIVKGFSLSEYRDIYNLSKNEYVTITISSAMGAIFMPRSDGESTCADFSWAIFKPTDPVCGTVFDKSEFQGGIVDFSYIETNFDLSFADCKFNHVTTKFVGCKFGEQDIIFNRVDMDGSDFYFHVSDFKKGDLDFSESYGLSGRIQIASCNFEQRNLNFFDMQNGDGDFIFADFELSSGSIGFTNSEVRSLLCYRVVFSVRADLDVGSASYITIQNSTIGNTLILGNEGYQNYIHICLLGTLNLGQIRILNQFNKRLFSKQKKIYCPDPIFDGDNSPTDGDRKPTPADMVAFYERHLDLNWELCDTSYAEKAQQLRVLKENATVMGNYTLEDKYYLLARRYQNLSKIDSQVIQFQQLKNSRAANEVQHYHLAWLGILLGTIAGCLSFAIEGILLDIMCGAYATKPFKFLCSVLLLIIGFAGGYGLLEYNIGIFSYDSVAPSSSPLILSIYFSFFQFFQVDCGILIVSPVAHTISLIQKTLGMIILAVFTVSYTRKIIK